MSERLRTHVFLAAPSSLSVLDKDPGERSSCVSAAWTQVDLSWKDGKLQTKDQLAAGNQALTYHPIPDDEEGESANKSTDKECSASILEYLESCFPRTEPEPVQASTALSHQSQYISTWTLSQALILKGSPATKTVSSPQGTASSSSTTPELIFSPNQNATPATNSSANHQTIPCTSSLSHSAELFSAPSLAASDEEGCVLLQATAEGLLCSQGQESDERPSKKAKFSEEWIAKTSVNSAGSIEAGPTTLLARCVKAGAHYSVLVAVVHPCHLKEIKLKSGACVPLASIVVTDQSGVEMKVALWRRAAFWVLTVSPGDVLLITELQLNEDSWRGERVLRSTYNSKLLNLGRVPASGSLTESQQVKAQSLSPLYGFLIKHRPLLVSLPVPPAQRLNQLPYAIIRSLRLNTLVHMLLRVTHTHLSKEWQSEADSRCRSALQRRAVVQVEQPGGQQGALVLWGSAVEWLPRFTKDTGKQTVDCLGLPQSVVREGVTSDSPELHSTSWSSVRALDRSDPLHEQLVQKHKAAAANSSSSVELDMRTLLSQKYSGEVELRVHAEAFHFCAAPLSPNLPVPVLDSSSPAADVLRLLSGDVTFTGCGRCGAELDTDSNGIYCSCYPCLPHTSTCSAHFNRRRPSDVVQVPPVLLQKILTIPPDKLCRNSAPGSTVKNVELAAQRLHHLLSLPKKNFTVQVQSHFLCDENSVPLCQEFTLLDFSSLCDGTVVYSY
ncbi:hypothetical protein WMY93_018334 [Mugilogobius chulae]|uniref:Shieldin complex subunit 2 C-terminal domain-containing protein n=1 Tax=Mugilogobius chulae TaxID=88201 RepID=A0AAW0NIK5_9GOBI